jgi:hypothetical protein
MIPCSNDEIIDLEKRYNMQLPTCYTEFLKALGKGAEPFMQGSFCFYDQLDFIQLEAKALLKENNFKDLPKNAFVFWLHQGYQFTFFIDNESDNPSVFYFNETEKQIDFIKTYERLTDFFYDEIINSGFDIPSNLK